MSVDLSCRNTLRHASSVLARENAARAWTPSDTIDDLCDLAAHREETVRFLIAANPRVPSKMLEILRHDPSDLVRWAADRQEGAPPDTSRLPRITPVPGHSPRSPVNQCETLYRFVLLGLIRVDDEGRVWRVCRRHGRPGQPYAAIPCEPHRAEWLNTSGNVCVSVNCNRRQVTSLAHRLVYRAHKGPIPAGFEVHHVDHDNRNNHPDNPIVLPAGRHKSHHRSGIIISHKLTPDDVRDIRRMLADGSTIKAAAARYGVSLNCIIAIKKHRSWKNVE